MDLVPSIFRGGGQEGDFGWMLGQSQYQDALFVFNDNESQFRAYQRDPKGGAGCSPGGGNAAIRPRRCDDPPRAAGIPTGEGGGYASLTPHVRDVIADAIGVIRDLLATGRYTTVVYSAADESGRLGTGIFSVGDDVKVHIVAELRRVVAGADG